MQKKSSISRKGSYQIFLITKQPKENIDDNNEKRTNENRDTSNNVRFNETPKHSLTSTNQDKSINNLFLEKLSDEMLPVDSATHSLSYNPTNESSQPVIQQEITPLSSLNNEQRENPIDSLKRNTIDEILSQNRLLVRVDSVGKTKNKKQVFINVPSEMRPIFHQRRKRSFLVSGIALFVLSVIITIIVYVVIVIVRQIKKVNKL